MCHVNTSLRAISVIPLAVLCQQKYGQTDNNEEHHSKNTSSNYYNFFITCLCLCIAKLTLKLPFNLIVSHLWDKYNIFH